LTSFKLSDQSSRDRRWYLGKIGRAKQSSCSVVQGNEIVAWSHVFEKEGQGGWFWRAFRVTSFMLVGFVVLLVISAAGGKEIFLAEEICAGVSMLRCVVELDVH
jgi:hypothetical protein